MSNHTPKNRLLDSDMSQYALGGKSTPKSTSTKQLNAINHSSSKNIDDLLDSQIEPPTFIIEFNDNERTMSDTNENIYQIEKNVEFPPAGMLPGKQPVLYGYTQQFPQGYGDEVKYYNQGYPMMNEQMQYPPQNMNYAQLKKHGEYVHTMMPRQEFEIMKPTEFDEYHPLSKMQSEKLNSPEDFISSFSPYWMDDQQSKREKHLKEFMKKFMAFQVVEADKGSQVDKAFWDW
jgi:hypothetical protein